MTQTRGEATCLAIGILLWLALNVADAAWLYFYILACVNPNPRTAVNRTHSGFEGYTAMMFIFGFFWGMVNGAVLWFLLIGLAGAATSFKQSFYRVIAWLFIIFVLFPAAVFMVVMPFFGGWIVLPLVQKYAWQHRCDGYPMQVILDGKAYNNPRYTPDTAYFYIGNSPDPIFTYDITNPEDDHDWYFSFRNWDTQQSSIPLDYYPTLQNIRYNFIDNTLAGNCTVPVSPGSPNTTTIDCMNGSFNPGNLLSFTVNSSIPLNNTSNGTTSPFTTTLLRTVDKQWAFDSDAPSLILRTVNPSTNVLEALVLRTAVTKPNDCTLLKVCVSGLQREGGALAAEVLAPLGLMLMRQADYANYCTTPSSN